MTPQLQLDDFENSHDLTLLTPAERHAYTAVELHDYGVREFARSTDRTPGTIGNLLHRARNKLEEGTR